MRNHILKQHIHRVVLEDTTVVHTEKILQGMAHFRAIEQEPDGFIKGRVLSGLCNGDLWCAGEQD